MLGEGDSGGRAHAQRELAQILFTLDLAEEIAGRAPMPERGAVRTPE